MAEKKSLSNEVKEMKIGKSFMKGDNFHTFRYDFMPASLDTTKRAMLDIGEGHQVRVTVPNVEGSGMSNTVFKGSKKPYQKECVLIIDNNTGEITLEKLIYNVQLKKTRAEGSSKIRSNTPIDNSFTNKKSPAQKLSPQQKPHSTSFVQKCSPLPKSPLGTQASPNNIINSGAVPSMPSLSMLSLKTTHPCPETMAENIPPKQDISDGPEIGVLSSSSSDSSSDDSSGSSSSDNEEEVPPKSSPSMPNGLSKSFNSKENSNAAAPSSLATFSMPTANSLSSMPKFSQLSEDLKLSESDSDSDG